MEIFIAASEIEGVMSGFIRTSQDKAESPRETLNKVSLSTGI
jgi:hypothetical protein